MGNTTSHKHEPTGSEHDHYRHASPPISPGSPLTYSPQIPMEPISRAEDVTTNRGAPEFHGLAGWPALPKVVPVVIVWSHGGNHVEVEGSFDNWTTRQPLQKSGKDFTIIKLLPPGVYQYKFIVDGEWKYDPNQPAMFDEMRNVNNVIEVHEYVPENLEGVSGFEPPPSPPSSYNCPTPLADDYAKEPPVMPAHLQLTLLNVPPALDAQAVLPRPQHVILNHVYCQRGQNVQALVVGTTTRYKSKYITTVMYKPKARRRVLDNSNSLRSET
ncbi:hypothetical protein PLESTB_000162400 [Pleodorina starrii]|uniref:Association with the SNF1 complex (ASC) domain-containing protein n=1 Tax=Pleodorina starrii TaxID=330485 RepID=A0A9W6EXG5_9CHLO|nr:hypothetical protein PLESTM_000460700 [Pleodorina starrii]GLC48913.1 hypothetical protein PLESTB_000162400 [Pleodorina starrii]GLC72642.1 hypothetical protein PLESTF_001273800 [Pleodorina starrii]